ncbi:uncharacterized protein LOC62_02G002359 [Vanrija pseudolonga]|uniref:Uncharacterized protein n=1 Tax=Vanrija pseudolonga TaxID=143232 RepID=A0AAF1BFX2_9TREE|nr:hypothetical protein LOC62_02G002359 [Vanrija pseudolonga]
MTREISTSAPSTLTLPVTSIMTPSNGEPSTPARPRPIQTAYAVSPDGDESSPRGAAQRVEVELPSRSSLPRKTPVVDTDELDVISLPATPPDNSGFEVLDVASPIDLSEPLLAPRPQIAAASSSSAGATWLNTNVGSSSADSSRRLSSSGHGREEAAARKEEQRRERDLRELAKARQVYEQAQEVEQRQADADDSYSPTKKKPKAKAKPKPKKERAPKKTKASAPTSSASKRSTASSQSELPVPEIAAFPPSQSEALAVEIPTASSSNTTPRKRKSDTAAEKVSPPKRASPAPVTSPSAAPLALDDDDAAESGTSSRSPSKAAPTAGPVAAPQLATPAPPVRPLQPARSTPSGTPRTVKYKAASGRDNLASTLSKLPGAKRSGLSTRLRIAPLHAHIGTPARVLPPPPPKPSKKKVESDDDSDDEGKIKVGSREWLMMED